MSELKDKAQEELEGIVDESAMEKVHDGPNDVQVNVTVRGKGKSAERKSKQTLIDKSLLDRIPRVGECVHTITSYPVDEEEAGKLSAIKAFSLTSIAVSATALSADHKRILINGGEIELPITGKMREDDDMEVFYDENLAYERWKKRMTLSLEVANQRYEKAMEVKGFIEEALKENNF